MKIDNIDKEILHNFWTAWGISMKFSGKICLMIILKVTKNQGFNLSLEDTIFKKPQGGSNWTLPSRFRVKLPLMKRLAMQHGKIWYVNGQRKKYFILLTHPIVLTDKLWQVLQNQAAPKARYLVPFTALKKIFYLVTYHKNPWRELL